MDFIKDHKVLVAGTIITGLLYKYEAISKFFKKIEKTVTLDEMDQILEKKTEEYKNN